jgi:hypothetical protein
MTIEVWHVLSSSVTNGGKAMSSIQGYQDDIKEWRSTYALACPLANPLYNRFSRPYGGNDARLDSFGYYW